MDFIVGIVNSFMASILISLGLWLADWSRLIPEFSLNTGFIGTWMGVFAYLLVIVTFITLIKYTFEDEK